MTLDIASAFDDSFATSKLDAPVAAIKMNEVEP
jgi:hypothetical protein